MPRRLCYHHRSHVLRYLCVDAVIVNTPRGETEFILPIVCSVCERCERVSIGIHVYGTCCVMCDCMLVFSMLGACMETKYTHSHNTWMTRCYVHMRVRIIDRPNLWISLLSWPTFEWLACEVLFMLVALMFVVVRSGCVVSRAASRVERWATLRRIIDRSARIDIEARLVSRNVSRSRNL